MKKKKKTLINKIKTKIYLFKYRNHKYSDNNVIKSKELDNLIIGYKNYLEYHGLGSRKVAIKNEPFTKAILEHLMFNNGSIVSNFRETYDGANITVVLN